VNVIEALSRHISLIFDDGAVRGFKVRESCAVSGLYPFGDRFGYFSLGAA